MALLSQRLELLLYEYIPKLLSVAQQDAHASRGELRLVHCNLHHLQHVAYNLGHLSMGRPRTPHLGHQRVDRA